MTQEAFVKAYRALPSFRGDSAFYTWLYRIGINTAKNYLAQQPHMAVWPGLAICAVVLGFNLLGDGIRDSLDPKLRRLTEVTWKPEKTSSSSTD